MENPTRKNGYFEHTWAAINASENCLYYLAFWRDISLKENV